MKKLFIAFISGLLLIGSSGCSSNTEKEETLDPSEVERILLENNYEINMDLVDSGDDSLAWVEASGDYLFYYSEKCSADGANRQANGLRVQDSYAGAYKDVKLSVSEDADSLKYILYRDDGCRIDYLNEEPLNENCEPTSELHLQLYKDSLESDLNEIGLNIDSIYNYFSWYLNEHIDEEVLENESYLQNNNNSDDSAKEGGSDLGSTHFPTLGESNALEAAQNYLDLMPFSEQGLSDQLESEGYSDDEISYAVKNCDADWNEQAEIAAQSYLDLMPFSRQELIDQLLYEGFTKEQAEYGVSAVGY